MSEPLKVFEIDDDGETIYYAAHDEVEARGLHLEYWTEPSGELSKIEAVRQASPETEYAVDGVKTTAAQLAADAEQPGLLFATVF